MKVACYTPLLYGADYLGYAIRSVIEHVDKYIVLYTPYPSYGHTNGMPCPETQEQLFKIASEAAGNKLEWIQINHTHREGDHRNQAFKYAQGYDILAVVDADEVWEPDAFKEALEFSKKSTAFNIGAHHSGWYHFWRSFNEVCRDGFCPIRFHNLKGIRGQTDINCPSKVYHFGYCNTKTIMDFKLSCHGHRDELRQGWYHETFLNYKKDANTWLHPVSEQIWKETEDFNRQQLPDFMKEHPFYQLDRVE